MRTLARDSVSTTVAGRRMLIIEDCSSSAQPQFSEDEETREAREKF